MSKQVHAKDKNSDKFSLCMSFAKEVEENEGKFHCGANFKFVDNRKHLMEFFFTSALYLLFVLI